jgi:hypothetical protein
MAQEFIYGIILLFYGCFSILMGNSIWKRKSIQPLQARQPVLLIITLIGGFIVVCMICFREINRDQFHCSIYIWVSNMFLPLFVLPYCLRILKLKFIFHWNQFKTSNDITGTFYYKRRKLVSNTSSYFIVALSLIIQIIISYFMDLYANIANNNNNSTNGDIKSGCMFSYEFYPILIISSLYLLSFLICLFTLRGISDNFKIAREMKICTLIWIICGCLFFLFNLWPSLFWINEWFATSSWIILLIIGSNTFSILIPLIKSHTKNGQTLGLEFKTYNTQAYSTMNEILGDKTGRSRDLLETYLSEIGDDAPLRFINDVETYMYTSEEYRKNTVHTIKQLYIENQCDLELCFFTNTNENDKVRNDLLDNITSHNKDLRYPANIFYDAYILAIKYIEDTHLKNFVNSRHHSQLCKQNYRLKSVADGFEDEGLI